MSDDQQKSPALSVIPDPVPGSMAAGSLNRPAKASIRFAFRRARMRADAEITPLGLLAIGGMVGAILLAVPPIITAAGRTRRGR